IVNSQARALPPEKLPIARKARRQASWKMSSASVRSPASQRASANASSRWGETTRSNRALSSSPLTDPSRQEPSKYFDSQFSVFIHLVGALLEQRWNLETERLGGFQVDDELELDRELDGKVTRLLAFEDSVHIGRGAPIIVTDVVAVT